MQIFRGRAAQIELEYAREKRAPKTELPADWSQETDIDPSRNLVLQKEVRMEGLRSALGDRIMEVIALPPKVTSRIHFAHNDNPLERADVDTLGKSQNAICLEGLHSRVRFLEHNVALKVALGVQADYRLYEDNDNTSFPFLANSSAEYYHRISSQLHTGKRSKFMTVKEPLFFEFSPGRYFALEPPNNSDQLVIDHQISYDHIPTIGTQRVEEVLTPDRFLYLAQARTIGYGLRTAIARTMSLNGWAPKARLSAFGHGFGVDLQNVVFYDKGAPLNHRTEFQYADKNWEAICHELACDKTATLAFIEGRFTGKVTANRTSHHDEIDAIKTILRDPDEFLEAA